MDWDRPDKEAWVTVLNRYVTESENLHETLLVKLPVLVAVGPEPVSAVVMPLVGEAHGDPVVRQSLTSFLDEHVKQ